MISSIILLDFLIIVVPFTLELLLRILGIVSIEVHTVLSKLSFGPDVSSSLDINQLKHLVEGIRFIEKIKE